MDLSLLFILTFHAGELEGMFEEVELRLVSLEDVIETQALQEKQLDERFKLALYGEKKKGHFESLKGMAEQDTCMYLACMYCLEPVFLTMAKHSVAPFLDFYEHEGTMVVLMNVEAYINYVVFSF